jgi:hypothetical protein
MNNSLVVEPQRIFIRIILYDGDFADPKYARELFIRLTARP